MGHANIFWLWLQASISARDNSSFKIYHEQCQSSRQSHPKPATYWLERKIMKKKTHVECCSFLWETRHGIIGALCLEDSRRHGALAYKNWVSAQCYEGGWMSNRKSLHFELVSGFQRGMQSGGHIIRSTGIECPLLVDKLMTRIHSGKSS